MKEFKTVEEQVNLLERRNIVFKDKEKAKQILLTNNYYDVINGYNGLFLIENDVYKKGTEFLEIFYLYEFDRQLRNIFLEFILKIENILRSLIAYNFSKEYGNDNYLKLENFEIFENVNIGLRKKQKQLKFIQSLIGNINKNIADNVDKKYINHYLTKYGFIPLWVLVNILSFGEVCNFYKLMKQKQRIDIAKYFNINERDLTSLLSILCKTRNLCAHDEKLFDYKFESFTSINDTEYHKLLNLPKNPNNRYIIGKNVLFSVVISLKMLLSKEDYRKFHYKLLEKFRVINSKLKTINSDDILHAMNFPKDWYNLLKMS